MSHFFLHGGAGGIRRVPITASHVARYETRYVVCVSVCGWSLAAPARVISIRLISCALAKTKCNDFLGDIHVRSRQIPCTYHQSRGRRSIMHHFNHLETNAMMSPSTLHVTSKHSRNCDACQWHYLEVHESSRKMDAIVHAITIELKLGLLDEDLIRHVHDLTIEQLVAPPLLICQGRFK